MSPTNIIGTYFLGAIFTIGGLVFMLALGDHRFLFGVPYLVIGLLLLFGAYGATRRRLRQLAEEARTEAEARGEAGPTAPSPAGPAPGASGR